MEPAISKYKFTPPSAGKIVPRLHLIKLLTHNQSRRLSIILGQAAQGKSTLAAAYYSTVQHPKAWINLGEEDAESVDFYYALLFALKPFLNAADFELLVSYPSISLGPRADIPMYLDWSKTLFEKITGPILIVLDGLDQVREDAPAFNLISVLIEEASSEFHFIITSRREPPVDVRKKQIRRECLVITNDTLAFTLDEVKSFYNRIYDLNLDSKSIKQIYRISEGWAGGLVILGEILQSLPDADHAKYLSQDVPPKFKTEVFQYFSDEVFQKESASSQDLYIKSAIFDFVETEVLKSFLPAEEVDRFLNTVVKRNMFTEIVYADGKEAGFRYHKLFQEYLNTKFQQILKPIEQRALYLSIGRFYEKRGDLESAIIYYLKAQAYAEAIRSIEMVGQTLVYSGRGSGVLKWIEQLPQEQITDSPWILLYHAMCQRFTATAENVKRVIKARTLFKAQNDVKGHLLTLGLLLETCHIIGRDVIPFMDLIHEGEALLQSIDAEAYIMEKAALWGQIGVAYYLRVGNFKKGINACRQAYFLAKKLGIFPLQVFARAGEIASCNISGDLSTAKQLIKATEKLLKQYQNQEIKAIFNISKIEFLLIKGELSAAKKLVESSNYEAEKLGLIYLMPTLQMYHLWLKPHIGEFDDVPKIAEPLIAYLSSNNQYFFNAIILLYVGISYYHQGAYAKAKECVLKANQILSKKELYVRGQYLFCHYILGMIYYHLKEPKRAETELKKALEIFTEPEIGSVLIEVHIRLGLGLLCWKQKRFEEAVQYFSKGFSLAKENGYVHMMWMKKEDFARACIGALALEVNEADEYASYLLETRLGAAVEKDLKRLSKSRNTRIKANARSIRQTVYRANIGRLKINTFNGFEVIRGDTRIDEADWKRKSARMLLKAIISYGSGGVPKDVLMEDLWPESKPRAAENNFKVTLHRLRKTLEPHMGHEFGSAYIHQKNDLILLDQELCSIDADTFLDHIEKGIKDENRKDTRSAILHYKEAIALYKGDFLPQDLYKDSIERKRSELKQRLIDTLIRMAKIYEDRGAAHKAIGYYKTVIAHDPVMENAYQRLMVLYADTGQMSSASQTYQDLRSVLDKELDTKPSLLTESLYKKIREQSNS